MFHKNHQIFTKNIINFFVGTFFFSEIIIDFWYQKRAFRVDFNLFRSKKCIYIFWLKTISDQKRGVISHCVQAYVFNRTISDFYFLFAHWKIKPQNLLKSRCTVDYSNKSENSYFQLFSCSFENETSRLWGFENKLFCKT